jgi:hypothetical protein
LSLLAISTGSAILAIIALVIGLVVLLVVIALLTAVLSPAREIARHASEAPENAPFINNGVRGVDELSRTRNLASQVPPLALAYLQKVQAAAPAAGPPPASAPGPAPAGQSTGRISGGKP